MGVPDNPKERGDLGVDPQPIHAIANCCPLVNRKETIFCRGVADWINWTTGSDRLGAAETTVSLVTTSTDQWVSWTDQWSWLTGGPENTTSRSMLAGGEVNRTNYTALIGEFYDDFEHVSETYLMTSRPT